MGKNDYPRVPKARLAEIARLAEMIASENRMPSGATDIVSLLKKKDITVSYSSYGDAYCGLLEYREGSFHVYCNADRVGSRTSGRARFTLAHELGHYFIDEHRISLMSGVPLHGSNIDYHPRNPVEQEADCFASHLLMPEDEIRKCVNQSGGLHNVLMIHRRLLASVTAAAVRYCDIDIEPIAIIRWSKIGYGWKRLSNSLRYAGYRKTIEMVDRVDKDSATDRIRRGDDPGQQKFFESASIASRWFPFITPGSRSDIFLRECAMKLGDHGHITTLTLQQGEKLRG